MKIDSCGQVTAKVHRGKVAVNSTPWLRVLTVLVPIDIALHVWTLL